MQSKLLKRIGLSVLVSFAAHSGSAQDITQYVMPEKVSGISQHRMLLSGTWQFQFNPTQTWKPVVVPGELAMQGFAIEHDRPVLYKKEFDVPTEFKDKTLILRFDGVYAYARLWVNGKYVQDHFGGFTRWESDVTHLLRPGAKNEIKIEVTDLKDDISYASGYAHHPIAGILRDVELYALPACNLSNLSVETHLDSLYQDANLFVSVHANASPGSTIRFELTSPKGDKIELDSPIRSLQDGKNEYRFPITRPTKWDAEHPHLYQLSMTVLQEGREQMRYKRKVGFRDIQIRGNKMLVNGSAVKLRGACRHDIHPTLGRTTTRELDSLDVQLFRRSNMNFVRTSHYPPTERFLEFCDEAGLYVECETALCFVDTHRQKNYGPAASQNDTLFTGRYLQQLKEMVTSFRSHPSILFWSVGNECNYGGNFQYSYDWVKQNDLTRPAIFSYPGSVEKGKKTFDILSMHYPGVDGTMNQWGATTQGFQTSSMPSIFDEWAHVPCYTYSTLQDDPNIREFWGESLDKMWGKLFDAPGGLGGAIWGYIDETFMVPAPHTGNSYWIEYAHTAKPKDYQGDCVGYGEWGIVDVWRREKPEFWGTKKAYSPIKLLATQVPEFTSGTPLVLPVYNRFDHTNLKEIQVRFSYKDISGSFTPESLHPHRKGRIVLPAQKWEGGEEVKIDFLTNENELIDAYVVTLGSHSSFGAEKSSGKLHVRETADQLVIEGKDFCIPFDKKSGLIVDAVSKGEVVIEKGPFLNLDLNVNHLTGAEVREKARNYIVNDEDWMPGEFSWKKEKHQVDILLSGKYRDIAVEMNLRIHSNGKLEIDYRTTGEPNGWLRESGLKFYLPENIAQLKWKRKGYWSAYPENAFAGNKGEAPLYNSRKGGYGEDPGQPWNMDTHNYYYFANPGADVQKPLTNIAKGMKEHIYSYSLQGNQKGALEVLSGSGKLAARLNKRKDEQLILYVNTEWDYPEIAWGNYCKALDVVPCHGKITVQL
ncbi:MAG: glycoside hydrolase family 2 TIM barrel-domain containing protein [Bacteroidales bacterium]